jgi:hypothetical protein
MRKAYITSRTKSLASGRKTYQGRPCPVDGTRLRETDTAVCVQCRRSGTRYYWRHKESIAPKAAQYQKQKRLADRPKALWYGAKKNADRDGRLFTLKVEDITIPSLCPVLGLPLDSRDRNHSPSLDRRDNSKGYTKENVRVISMKANRLKGDASIEDIQALLSYMVDG